MKYEAFEVDRDERCDLPLAPTPTMNATVRYSRQNEYVTRITLRQLEYFCAVAVLGSLTAAAAEKHVTRSTIAAALRDMETGLGTQLFVRHRSSGLELTEAGREVQNTALGVIAQVEDLESIASSRELRGILSVGCFGSVAPTILPRIIKRYSEIHPGVEVVIEVGATDTLVDHVKIGRFDLIVSYKLHVNASLSTLKLYDTRMYAALPHDHRLAKAPAVAAEVLAGEPMVMITTPPSEEDVGAYFSALELAPNIAYRVSNLELARSLVAAGLGYGLFLQRPRRDHTYDGVPLAALPLDPLPSPETLSIAWPAGRRLSARATAFVRLAEELGRSLAPPSVYPAE